MIFSILTASFVILMDRLLKNYIITYFEVGHSASFIPGIIEWMYVRNEGASWGLLNGYRFVFILVTVLIIFYLVYLIYRNKNQSYLLHFTYGLLLGGAIGNLWDRIIYGYVIDMIRLKFIDFPVFNIADSSLTIGVILMIFLIIFDKNAEDIL